MPYRVEEVVLVSSLYDAFILREDGQVAELLLESGDLTARDAPQVVHIPDAEDALQHIAKSRRNVLVMVTPQMGSLDPVDFAQEVKQHAGAVPVVLLGYDASATRSLLERSNTNPFDGVFLWSGDTRILNAIVTLIEDRANCLHDCAQVGVSCILLVEDSLNFLSSYLPLLYSEILHQSRSVLSEGLNLPDKLQRLRARPKLLLARDLRSARDLFDEYREHMLGVISDVGIPRNRSSQKPDATAGVEFLQHVQQVRPELPLMMQSAREENAEIAEAMGITFVQKGSSLLHQEMRDFLLNNFGFGAFRFEREADQPETEAHSLQELERIVAKFSSTALLHHARGGHFSTWLRARTHFRLADSLEQKPAESFENGEDLRAYLMNALRRARLRAQSGAIVDFHRSTYDETIQFARIGKGSLGGKARGLAFVNRLLPTFAPQGDLENVRVLVPRTVVLTTEVFDDFVRRNRLQQAALGNDLNQKDRHARFMNGRFPTKVTSDFRSLLGAMEGPLAIRSSSLLEDSHHQPFAGIYETVMIRNVGSERERLAQLCDAVKEVFASTYSDRARAYRSATAYRHEEEKMAVIIQPVYGRERNGRVYPTFSGVARSHNYYPYGDCGPEDGVCMVALGLGRLVVAGEGGIRFCPQRPQSLPEFSAVDDILQNAQRYFYALPLNEDDAGQHIAEGATCHDPFQPCQYPIEEADADRVLHHLASTYLSEDHRITDGASRSGRRLVTFANILKHGSFPLAPLVQQILRIGQEAMGCPVEVEFAVDLHDDLQQPQHLGLLQIRPMALSEAEIHLDLDNIDSDLSLCQSQRALGNGRISGIRDILFVDPSDFDRSSSQSTAQQIAQLNAQLKAQQRPYLLVGPGRWGSQDSWLGIGVEWNDISHAKVLVETGFEGMRVTPSEGSHFFHNITSFRVGYFTVNPHTGEGSLDLEWLREQPQRELFSHGVQHIQLEQPLEVLLDGRAARGVILKRESSPNGS